MNAGYLVNYPKRGRVYTGHKTQQTVLKHFENRDFRRLLLLLCRPMRRSRRHFCHAAAADCQGTPFLKIISTALLPQKFNVDMCASMCWSDIGPKTLHFFLQLCRYVGKGHSCPRKKRAVPVRTRLLRLLGRGTYAAAN